MRIVILLVLMGCWPGLLQAATVYRCDLPEGRVGFSDRPCEGGGGQEMDVTADKIGGSLAPSPEYLQFQQRRDSTRQIERSYRRAQSTVSSGPCQEFASTVLRRMVIRHQVVRGMTKADALRAWGTPSRVNGTQHAYHWARGGSSYFYIEGGCVSNVQGGYMSQVTRGNQKA